MKKEIWESSIKPSRTIVGEWQQGEPAQTGYDNWEDYENESEPGWERIALADLPGPLYSWCGWRK
jgi:hypothetical protein